MDKPDKLNTKKLFAMNPRSYIRVDELIQILGLEKEAAAGWKKAVAEAKKKYLADAAQAIAEEEARKEANL